MPDMEKVIKGLEICTKDIPMSNAVHKSDLCKECPYYNEKYSYCWNQIAMMRDALAMLKEQVPLEPYACEGDMKCGNGCEIVGYIRESDGKIERLANYCPYCGRPVKWD